MEVQPKKKWVRVHGSVNYQKLYGISSSFIDSLFLNLFLLAFVVVLQGFARWRSLEGAVGDAEAEQVQGVRWSLRVEVQVPREAMVVIIRRPKLLFRLQLLGAREPQRQWALVTSLGSTKGPVQAQVPPIMRRSLPFPSLLYSLHTALSSVAVCSTAILCSACQIIQHGFLSFEFSGAP